MNKTIGVCLFIVTTASVVVVSLCSPWVLSDNNDFLRGFVNHELLSFLGVLVTITLASAANLHLSLNQLEENGIGSDDALAPSRASIKKSAYSLVVVMILAVVLVVAKPLVVRGAASEVAAALFNGIAILLVLFGVLVLGDLTKMAFLLGPPRK